MKKNKTMIFLFILPTVLCLLFMYVYPIVRTVIMSFFKVESLTASTSTWSFYGLQNYFKILRNAGFISSMKNMVMIWLVGGIITMCLSMLMAVILTSGIRGAKFFKAAIYMPNIISAVALATMWIQYVFNYDYGLLNQIVKAFGGENVRWLGYGPDFLGYDDCFHFWQCWLLYADFYQRHRRYPAGFVRSCHHRRREYP